MIKVLEQAIDKVRALPEDRQAYVAHVIDQIAGDGEPHRLSDNERRMIREGVADLDAGRVVSDADMEMFWNRHRG